MTTIYLLDRATQLVSEEIPPAKKALIWLYKESKIGKCVCFLLARSSFLSWLYAQFQNLSISKASIMPFIEKYRINTEEFLENPHTFSNFSKFFERHLKPEARPIGPGFISPADGRLEIVNPSHFDVKGDTFDLDKLVKDRNVADRFRDGHIVKIRLAPDDYHRLHAPLDGIVQKITNLSGVLYSVSPIALRENIKILHENKRTLIDFGDYAMVLVGATFVGSIHLDIKEGNSVQKGDEIAYFSFGGSMCLLLLKKDFSLDKDLYFSGGEVRVKMGEQIANKS
ncbi:MAG: phosphatidylserine decarboxylase [Chlamydiia bacterium]